MTAVRVLVVDDAPEVRRLVEEVIKLNGEGWEVVADAANGVEGVERARAVQPDLVLLDISMPVMDGLEALPLMREAAPHAAIVILTGFAGGAARESAMRAGASAYLEKDELLTTLIPRLETVVSTLRVRQK